jgi:hypothetical protein
VSWESSLEGKDSTELVPVSTRHRTVPSTVPIRCLLIIYYWMTQSEMWFIIICILPYFLLGFLFFSTFVGM